MFLRGLVDDARNNLNLLGQGDIAQKPFDQICAHVGNSQGTNIDLAKESELEIANLDLLMLFLLVWKIKWTI